MDRLDYLIVQKMLNVWMNYYSDEQKEQLKIAGYVIE